MKRKELKNIAEKIAMYESIIRNDSNKDKIQNAKNQIMHLTSSVKSIDDFLVLDDEITKILNKKH